MTADQGFVLHPGAAQDITDIWEFIAQDNPFAARRVREDILETIRKLVQFPHQGHVQIQRRSGQAGSESCTCAGRLAR